MLHLIAEVMLSVLEWSKIKIKLSSKLTSQEMFVHYDKLLLSLCVSGLLWFIIQYDDPNQVVLSTDQQQQSLIRDTQELMTCTLQLRSKPSEHFQKELHFLVSNEDDYRSWYPLIRQHGGIYLGVGAEQNYLLAAWTQAAQIILLDYDAQIHDLHRFYQFFFTHHATLTSFNRQWFQPMSRELELKLHLFLGAWLMKHYPRVPLQIKLQWIREKLHFFIAIYPLVQSRMRKVRALYEGYRLPTFLTEEAQYQHLRELWKRELVWQICADLTQESTWDQLTLLLMNFVSELGVKPTALYLSNLMQYQALSPKAWNALRALPWSQKSYVLYTWGTTQRNYHRSAKSLSKYQYYIERLSSDE